MITSIEKNMNMRLRGFEGFINLSDVRKAWVMSNPSFSVYQGSLQIGRITFENEKICVEVFVEEHSDLLHSIANDVILTS